MPLEIRNQIWALVLGDQLIHLEYLAKATNPASNGQFGGLQVWKHVVCEHDSPEDLLNKKCILGRHVNGNEETIWQKSHHRCDAELACKGHNTIDLRTLQVCRQVYIETNDVLWSTNTFSFDDGAISFDRFMSTRTGRQKRSLRKVRLQMDWRQEDRVLNQIFSMRLIKSLAGLRSLRLQINYAIPAALYQRMIASGNNLFTTRRLEFVHRMAKLPLTNVEVFVDNRFPPWCMGATLWTAEDRMEYAEGIRKILLDPIPKERSHMPKSMR